jgi:hypothetical protein
VVGPSGSACSDLVFFNTEISTLFFGKSEFLVKVLHVAVFMLWDMKKFVLKVLTNLAL